MPLKYKEQCWVREELQSYAFSGLGCAGTGDLLGRKVQGWKTLELSILRAWAGKDYSLGRGTLRFGQSRDGSPDLLGGKNRVLVRVDH